MRKTEQRACNSSAVEIRETGRGMTLRGLIPYESRSVDLGGFFEIIMPTAFNKTLRDGAAVLALLNHDSSRVLGSTRSRTLRLRDTTVGLECEVDLPETSFARDLRETIGRGDVGTMSFGFQVVQDEVRQLKDGTVMRDLIEVKLLEVSFGVAFPAYGETTTALQ